MGDVVTIHEDLEAMRAYKAMRAAHERWQAKRTARLRSWRFWLNWRQVTTTPDIPSDEVAAPTFGPPPSGGVSGVVGSEPPAPPVGAAGPLSQPVAAAPRRPHDYVPQPSKCDKDGIPPGTSQAAHRFIRESHPAGIRFM